jgi:hypothetical protein
VQEMTGTASVRPVRKRPAGCPGLANHRDPHLEREFRFPTPCTRSVGWLLSQRRPLKTPRPGGWRWVTSVLSLLPLVQRKACTISGGKSHGPCACLASGVPGQISIGCHRDCTATLKHEHKRTRAAQRGARAPDSWTSTHSTEAAGHAL